MAVDEPCADGRVTLGNTFGRSDHANVDSDMSHDWLQTSRSGQRLTDAFTTVWRGHDDTGDVLEVCGEVDDPGVGLLVTVQDVYPGKGLDPSDVKLGLICWSAQSKSANGGWTYSRASQPRSSKMAGC